ncbi:hypothetical protein B0A52_03176 [Exophiala mesophila]|uniref:Uncharacterized protein n=1 Tax=Exophiala mesophila TaxID=212818 RepID=A0A438NAN5_EXOME|nr:hypothetical protein B0A52_03176 [Exophiala mesophila]
MEDDGSIQATQAKDEESFQSLRVHDLLSLKGKVTVITGGGRGIGLAMARAVIEMGGDVALLDRLDESVGDLGEMEQTFQIRMRYYRVDVTNMSALSDAFMRVKEDFGSIDNCITAAGIVVDRPFSDHEWDECSRLLNVNVMGSFFSAQLAAQVMREQSTGGSIIFICSSAAHAATPSRRMSMYSATKGAILSLTRSLAVELAPFNIRVNCVSPGFIATEMVLDEASKNENVWQGIKNGPPLKRIGYRAELKGITAYLLSSAAAYTTGAECVVDGGMTCGRI